MDAIDCLKNRRSIRSYLEDEITRETIEQIVDCGRLAASGVNVQPWTFYVVTDAEKRRQIAETADYGKFIVQAPVCIAVVCEDVKYRIEDGSAATMNILNAAYALGLGSCWVAGDKKEYADRIRQIVGAPDGHKLISLIAVGKAAEERNPPKKSLADVIRFV